MSNYRSPKLLSHAKDCPRCMSCGLGNDGTVVGCHSNSQRHGKGMGLKAHDIPAFCCSDCHDRIDGRAGNLTRNQRDEMFLDAVFFTTLWLLQTGRMVVK